ncbi:MAG TPA: RNA polymerase sigma factor [Acidobacteriota bacterium]|nr:RNA polymerase sigma factor [Acidobacteriota bacterium]
MRGDEDAKLFEDMMTSREAVFRICLGFSRNASDAEDLSQDVFLKAYRSLSQVRHPYLVKEWLFRVARNTCLDHVKKRRLARELEMAAGPGTAADPRTQETSLVTAARLRSLKTAVSRLPRKQREVFVLREYGGLSYEELGHVVGAKAGTIMSRLNRARAAVATFVKEAEHD